MGYDSGWWVVTRGLGVPLLAGGGLGGWVLSEPASEGSRDQDFKGLVTADVDADPLSETENN